MEQGNCVVSWADNFRIYLSHILILTNLSFAMLFCIHGTTHIQCLSSLVNSLCKKLNFKYIMQSLNLEYHNQCGIAARFHFLLFNFSLYRMTFNFLKLSKDILYYPSVSLLYKWWKSLACKDTLAWSIFFLLFQLECVYLL